MPPGLNRIVALPWNRLLAAATVADQLYKHWQTMPEGQRKQVKAQAEEVRRHATSVRTKSGQDRADAVRELGRAAAELRRRLRAP